ncbi:MAG: hypothetical protein EOP11_08130 [Proteobacteria bacterium]|nr:MAG: hypothetical protein EOP11_08130 [Pseudomonadota bacterium]
MFAARPALRAMANTPSINPTQESARNTPLGSRFDKVLFDTVDALEAAQIPFAFIGGVATGGLARPRATHDLDIFVRPEDAEHTLNELAKAGFRTEKFDLQWLFKAFKDDIMVDIIFRSEGEFYYDEEVHAHRRFVDYHGKKVPVVAPEDLAIIKCAVHYEGGPHHWHDALNLLSRFDIDWPYLLQRSRRATRRVLSLLLYAQSNDVLIPNWVIVQLFESVFGTGQQQSQAAHAIATMRSSAPQGYQPALSSIPPPVRSHQSHAATEARSARGAEASRVPPAPSGSHAPAGASASNHLTLAPEYVVAHIREALAEDGRTIQQDLKILLNGNQIVVKGDCPTEAQCKAVEEVIRAAAPGYEIANQARIVAVTAPERAEEIS